MKILQRFLSVIIAVLAVVFISAVVFQKVEKGSQQASRAISQVTSEANAAVNLAASQINAAVSQETIQSQSGAGGGSAAGTSPGGSPAIPVAKTITSAPVSGQPQSSVTAPVAAADLQSFWGDTGTSGLIVYEYGKTLLNNDEKKAYVSIASAILNVEPSTTIDTTLTPTQIKKIYEYYVFDHAEVFYLSGVGLSYSQMGSSYSYTITYQYKYSGNKNQILSMREQMGQKALEVLGAASGKSTDLSKEKALHDKLIKLCSYDVAAAQNPSAYPDSFSAYGAFVNNKAVCEGYAQAMKLLLSSVGIKSLYITGEADGGSHAWNMVEIGGQWSYLDATFDDPVYTDQNGNYVSYNKVSYTYFNFAGNSDHVPGSFDNSDPFSDSSENYAVMPQVG
jgi:hypothetical protein